MHHFDEAQLKARLERLDPQGKTLFATCCAERLFLLHKYYSERTGLGSPSLLREALDELWEALLGHRKADTHILLTTFQELLPDDDKHWHPLNPLGDDAVCAVVYACRAESNGETENAVWCARREYDAADYIVTSLDPTARKNHTESTILNSKVVQTALSCQLSDIAELEAMNERNWDEQGAMLRERAVHNGISLHTIIRGLIA